VPTGTGWLEGPALVDEDGEWRRKGATLSDKTARKEFGLTQDEIIAAIEAGQLQYRVSAIHGNPWLRLLRREIEDVMNTTFNDRQHKQKMAKVELLRVKKELKQLRSQLRALEEQQAVLLTELEE
jgi:predicted transcriptional regulator